MPYLTILRVPIGLNTLLTYRVIHVKDTLHENNILSQKMEMDNERIKHEKELEFLAKENFKNQLEVETLTRENLELKVDLQNRQLLASAMQIQKKDEIIHNISQEVSKISKKEHSNDSTNKIIRSLLQNQMCIRDRCCRRRWACPATRRRRWSGSASGSCRCRR